MHSDTRIKQNAINKDKGFCKDILKNTCIVYCFAFNKDCGNFNLSLDHLS